MSMATGFILMGVVSIFASIALAGLVIWARNRSNNNHDDVKHV